MYETWLLIVNDALGCCTEGMLADDFPEYGWREAFECGINPVSAATTFAYRLELGLYRPAKL